MTKHLTSTLISDFGMEILNLETFFREVFPENSETNLSRKRSERRPHVKVRRQKLRTMSFKFRMDEHIINYRRLNN